MGKFPEKQLDDYVYGGTKAALNLIPEVGRSLSVIFETVFSSPLDKRKEEWFKQLAQIVEELCEKVDGLTPESLSNNEEFISFYLQASNIALRTHNKEKLKVLNSSVKNCILLKNIDESKKMIFLRIIDEMTPFHFQFFKFLLDYPEHHQNNPLRPNQQTPLQMSRGVMYDIWSKVNPGVPLDEPIVNIVIQDLKNYGLLISNFRMDSIDPTPFSMRDLDFSTQFGKEFMRFINNDK